MTDWKAYLLGVALPPCTICGHAGVHPGIVYEDAQVWCDGCADCDRGRADWHLLLTKARAEPAVDESSGAAGHLRVVRVSDDAV